jgi:hypothetical protein
MGNRFDQIDRQTLDQLGDLADDVTARGFPFLKLVLAREVQDWKDGQTVETMTEWHLKGTVVSHEEAEALVEEFSMGWTRFDKHGVEEANWRRMLGEKTRPPRPDSFTDKTKWETWKDRKRDPWQFRIKGAFRITTGPLAGTVATFTGDTEGGRMSLRDLLIAFKKHARRFLVTFSAKVRDSEDGVDPIFVIVGVSETDDRIPGLAATTLFAILCSLRHHRRGALE